MARTRTGQIQRRGPTIIRQPRSGTSNRPVDLNAAIAMALRHGLIVINPNRPLDDQPYLSPERELLDDDFHHHEPPQNDTAPLQDEFITQYAMRRDRLSAAWKSMEKAMTAAFFACQYHTKNWTTSNTYLDPLDECDCQNTRKRAVDLIHTHGLTTQDHWAAKCPACFGPEMPDEESHPGTGEAFAIIAMDGNFQHRHHKFASTDDPKEADYPPNFIPPSEINTHEAQCQSTDHQAASLRTSCSDTHKAANDVRNSVSWDKFDDTGLFGSCCRHDIPLKLNNINQTGEK
ncbi:hypothetical protein PGT21_031646 [Puccinia graminis f. sp. tritici]|uniref:CxC1-like cysteine cluster associated with KDZ transposases domain-containing protein n=1 Tax=Puccinia graminis f. sp. tritici TaxID=56615 RepID=A0A5B0QPL2_PUCGR|nr:hypothetical protein PGT21_031646 [Puccinia graminis f. sp. tritici]